MCVLGYIDISDSESRRIFQHFSRSTVAPIGRKKKCDHFSSPEKRNIWKRRQPVVQEESNRRRKEKAIRVCWSRRPSSMSSCPARPQGTVPYRFVRHVDRGVSAKERKNNEEEGLRRLTLERAARAPWGEPRGYQRLTLGQPTVNLGSTLGQPWVNVRSTLCQRWGVP